MNVVTLEESWCWITGQAPMPSDWHINPGCTGWCYTRDQRATQPTLVPHFIPPWCLVIFPWGKLASPFTFLQKQIILISATVFQLKTHASACLKANTDVSDEGSPGGRQRSGAVLKRHSIFFGSLSPNQIDGNTLEVTQRAGWWESPWGSRSSWLYGVMPSSRCPEQWKVYAWAANKQEASRLVEAHWKIPPSVLQRQEWEHPGVESLLLRKLSFKGIIYGLTNHFFPRFGKWQTSSQDCHCVQL